MAIGGIRLAAASDVGISSKWSTDLPPQIQILGVPRYEFLLPFFCFFVPRRSCGPAAAANPRGAAGKVLCTAQAKEKRDED